jgi:hypothetical protein
LNLEPHEKKKKKKKKTYNACASLSVRNVA